MSSGPSYLRHLSWSISHPHSISGGRRVDSQAIPDAQHRDGELEVGVPRLSDPAVSGTGETLRKQDWLPPTGPFCPWVAAESGERGVQLAT